MSQIGLRSFPTTTILPRSLRTARKQLDLEIQKLVTARISLHFDILGPDRAARLRTKLRSLPTEAPQRDPEASLRAATRSPTAVETGRASAPSRSAPAFLGR